MAMTVCLLVLLVLLAATLCQAEIIEFVNHKLYPLQPEFWTIFKYAPKAVPHWPPGNGHSFIDFSHLKFSLACSSTTASRSSVVDPSCSNSSIDVLMFAEPTGKDWVEFWPEGQFCCTDDMEASGTCPQSGKFINPTTLLGSVHEHLELAPNQPTSLHLHNIIYHNEIEETGVYVVLLTSCDASPAIFIDGSLDSMDPYGYVPADEFPNIYFYGILSLFYSLLAFVWIVLCAFHRDELIVLQHWISGVLAFGLLETAVQYGYYLNWNDTGVQHVGIGVLATLFGVMKRTLSRVVIQFVALGYGIIRPTIGDDMNRVLLLAVVYFLLSTVYTLVTKFDSNSNSMTDPDFNLVSLVILMLAGVDTAFYIWIITSINNLMITLAARKLAVKYILYRNFRYVLFLSLFFTFVWVIYGSVHTATDGFGDDNNWESTWTIDALWELTYYVLFLVICVMWSPYKNSHRFAAQSYELVSLAADEDWQSVNNTVENLRQTMQDEMNEEEKANNQPKRKKYLLDDDDDDDDGGNKGNNNNDNIDNPFSGALDTTMAIMKKN